MYSCILAVIVGKSGTLVGGCCRKLNDWKEESKNLSCFQTWLRANIAQSPFIWSATFLMVGFFVSIGIYVIWIAASANSVAWRLSYISCRHTFLPLSLLNQKNVGIQSSIFENYSMIYFILSCFFHRNPSIIAFNPCSVSYICHSAMIPPMLNTPLCQVNLLILLFDNDISLWLSSGNFHSSQCEFWSNLGLTDFKAHFKAPSTAQLVFVLFFITWEPEIHETYQESITVS